jgi:hypothetical protein
MIAPVVHELTQLRARNEFLEREHARLMVVVSRQADDLALLRSGPLLGARNTLWRIGHAWADHRPDARGLADGDQAAGRGRASGP